jgi:hypothetical protein
MGVQGQDWSGFQAAKPATSGLGFAFIKATEGHTMTNSEQAQQAATARAAGLVVGFYHFLWPGDIELQAQYFVNRCASVDGDLLACDWETTSAGTAASGAEKDAFLAAVRRLRPRHQVLLYCNRSFWVDRDTTSDCGDGLWIADPSSPAGHPAVKHAWTIHQYGERGVDQDLANFPTEAAMRAWARARLTTPSTPTPGGSPVASALTTSDIPAIGRAVAADLTAPDSRDMLAMATLWWLRLAVDPSLPLPAPTTQAGKDAVSAVTDLRAALAARPPLQLTESQVTALAEQLVPAVADQLAATLVPKLVTALGHALDGTK